MLLTSVFTPMRFKAGSFTLRSMQPNARNVMLWCVS